MSSTGIRRLGWWAGTCLALLILVALLKDGGGTTGSSSLAKGPQGWRGMRAVVEAEGGETLTLDQPLANAPDRGTWVLAFPWSGWPRSDDAAGIRRHLESGGDVLLAYTGNRGAVWEGLMLGELGLAPVSVRSDPPLWPTAWYRHIRQVQELEPTEAWVGPRPRPLTLPALDQAPEAPPEARVLYRLPDGQAAVFIVAYQGGGRLVVLPAAAFANTWLGEPGNGDLLASLRGWLRAPWVFDEFHHGLVAPRALEEDAHVRGALDGVLFHLLALWALGVWALARRLGPPWREEVPVTGSTGAFLLGLGRLHDALGHHSEGARRLVERRRSLAGEPAAGGGEVSEALGASGFVALARRWSPGEVGGRRRTDSPSKSIATTPPSRQPPSKRRGVTDE